MKERNPGHHSAYTVGNLATCFKVKGRDTLTAALLTAQRRKMASTHTHTHTPRTGLVSFDSTCI